MEAQTTEKKSLKLTLR